jgi:hypothetical protein
MKIALCFFGITRSLKYTIDSINKNILEILKKNKIEYDIFMHTYKLDSYENIRNNEKQDIVDNEEYKLLNPKYLQIDIQDTIKIQLKLEQYRTHKDPWNTKYNSVDNFILAQYSKFCLVKMIEETKNKYQYIIYIRPDCLYINKLDINYFKYVNDKSICIPNFHLIGKHLFNDRFCIANMKNYKTYGNIFELLLNISKKQTLHSETIIGEIIKNNKINIIRVPFNFTRVRCNGKIDKRDLSLLKTIIKKRK